MHRIKDVNWLGATSQMLGLETGDPIVTTNRDRATAAASHPVVIRMLLIYKRLNKCV